MTADRRVAIEREFVAPGHKAVSDFDSLRGLRQQLAKARNDHAALAALLLRVAYEVFRVRIWLEPSTSKT